MKAITKWIICLAIVTGSAVTASEAVAASDLIAENLASSGTLEEGQSITFSGTVRNQGDAAAGEYGWAQVGSGLSGPTQSTFPGLAALDSTDIAFIDQNVDELRTYRWNGSSWSQVGSGLAISSVNYPVLAALNSTDVALIDSGYDQLRTYRWNGSSWSQVGSGLTISALDTFSMTALSATDVAIFNSSFDQLRTYRWNGSSWSQVGSGLAIAVGSPGFTALTALNSTDVAFAAAFSDNLRTYRWNGSSWSQVGSSLAVSGGVDNPGLTALNSTDVVLASFNDLRTYRWDGANWSQIGNDGLVSGTTGYSSIAALNSTDIAYTDNGINNEIRTYRFSPMGSFTSRFCIDNASCLTSTSGSVGEPSTNVLAAGGTENETSSSWTATLGSHTLYFCTDVGTDVTESDEGNNCSSMPFTVTAAAGESDLLTEALGYTGTLEAGQSITFSGDVRNQGTDDAAALAWEQTGNALVTSPDQTMVLSITTLNDTDVVFPDPVSDTIRTFRFNGTNWTEFGTPYAIGGSYAIPAVTALNSTDIALFDSFSDNLRTYRFNGSTWSQVGSSFYINAPNSDITALNSTDIAMIDHGTDDLVTYRFNGSTWSQVGNPLYLGSASCPQIVAMDGDDVALFASDSDSLTTYHFDGTNWVQVGNAYSLGSSTGCLAGGLAGLSATDVAYVRSSGSIKTLRFDGTDWSQVGTTSTAGVSGNFGLEALDSSSVAFFTSGDDTLRTLNFEPSPFTSRFCIDNASCLTSSSGSVGTTSTGVLAAGATETDTSPSWTATEGSHTLYFCADTDAEVTESDETNNCASLPFTVAAAPGSPDLITENLGYSGTLETGQSISFSGRVRNQGDASTASAWDISSATFSQVALDYSGPGYNSMLFNDDGTVLYAVSDSADEIDEYALATPYDISTASFTQVALYVGAQVGYPYDLLFNNDGTVLYVLNNFPVSSVNNIHEYTLATPFDISTASYSQIVLDVTGQEVAPTDILFNNTGTVLYIAGFQGGSGNINEYTLATPHDISTASFTQIAFSAGAQDGAITDMLFNNSGTTLYTLGYNDDSINEYALATPYDISTASFTQVALYVGAQENLAYDMLFNNDGSVLYVEGVGSDNINEYTLGSGFTSRFCIDNASCLTSTSGSVGEPSTNVLAAGGTENETSSSWTATLGSHTLYFCVDVDTDITESDEGNNCSSLPFTVTTPAACADGIDNEPDGLTDYPNDPGCTDANDDDEYNAPLLTQCPSQTFEASPLIVRAGEDTTLEWVNTYAEATCTVTGGELTASPETSTGDCSTHTATVSPQNITTYTLTCDYDPSGNNVTWTDTITVQVTPNYQDN